MRGSKIAAQIVYEQKQNEFWKDKAQRQKCKIDNKMNCDKCQYADNCLDADKENTEGE